MEWGGENERANKYTVRGPSTGSTGRTPEDMKHCEQHWEQQQPT